ncbi:TonB-dependent receptor [Novosphingobium aromaticivorans DSM 12444]|uniref:TonB-dependent receptor n=1 Tax=Novosphingobium aromaticivorans (strain ATCC 700278 / DSM 12444 / CCUG 56034 / CIP 105152 / NBRC 16084 / F199) TaxID=279238 RepID=Q2G5J0_NOVAD|nr:TonB-dependent receptor [Novosphingobium aromaticivorans]ABD26883.1 TonB-dependent receptor [Novosphingobium aromaticivorans DSM 12444]SCY44528.1 iron complex outermembrane recepter protein [Novosphingobium aromaticivorans]
MRFKHIAHARALALSASALTLCLGAQAHAQEAAQEQAAEETGGISEIVVTAQKVAENVQDVPIAITALTAERLENAGTTSLEGLTQLVPSVTFRKGTTSANSAIVMRGVGTITFSVAAEPSVSTVVDGVVLSRSGQAFMDLVDAERLEVLRGPQGTLFGKNASAGLVNIVSKGGTDTLQAEGRAEWYEGDEYRLRASVSGPLADGLTARVTGFYGSYDGNITNIYGGKNEKINGYEHYGARGIIDYDNGGSKFRLIADYFKANDDCCADVTTVSRGTALDKELGLPGGVAQGLEQRYVNHNLVTQTKDRQWSLTASGDFDVFESHTLSVVAGYRNWKNEEIREGDFLPRALVGTDQLHDNGEVRTEQLSLEVRLASDQTKPFFYQVGAFAWGSNNQQDFTRSDVKCATSTLPVDPLTGAQPCNLNDTVNTIFPTATSFSDVKSRNYAVFGQATYRFSDLISLTGGLRYTWDDLSFTHTRAPGVNATDGLPATGAGINDNPAGGKISAGGNGTNTSRGSSNNGNLSGRAVLQITPSDDVMLYGSYTRGYKGPAFNVFFNHTAPTNAVPIDEETSDAFEIGLKSQFLDNRVQFNAAAFTVTYNGFQANNFVLLNGAVVSNLTNAGSVRSKGFEADLLTVPVDGLTLRASAAYADAKVLKFNPNPSTNAPDARNGTRLPLAPKFTWTLGGSYERDLGGFKVYLDSDFRHVGKQFSDLGESGPIAAYGIWNAGLGFSDAEDLYRLTFHVRNITDKSYALLNVSSGQRLQIPRDADRYFGVSLRAKIR